MGVAVQRGCDYKIRVGRDGGHHRERYFMSVVTFVFSVQKYKNTKIQYTKKKHRHKKKYRPITKQRANRRICALSFNGRGDTVVTGGDGVVTGWWRGGDGVVAGCGGGWWRVVTGW